jgi:UDP-GlcNAc:undecaprenyl-phosphate/decaprenyl-phosphate GlcNAc-1-phosphate transferase
MCSTPGIGCAAPTSSSCDVLTWLGNWLLAFGVAAGATAVATRLLRRLALSVGFVDRPGPVKSHARDTPYLGGVGIALVALGAWLFGHDFGLRLAVVVAAAAAVACVAARRRPRAGPLGAACNRNDGGRAVVAVGLHVGYVVPAYR